MNKIMANLGQTFVADELPKDDAYALLPEGWYTATITNATLEKTKAGTGTYIKMEVTITGPTHQNQKLFPNVNISNPNPKAEEIGLKQLGKIINAIGIPQVNDTDQLLGGNLQVKVKTKPANDKYNAQNEVKDYKAIEGSLPPAPPVAPGFTRPAEPAQQANKAPWMK